MSQQSKTPSKNNKVIMYISAVAIAVIAAIIMVILLVHLLKNPPDVIINSSISSRLSTASSYDTLSHGDIVTTPTTNENADAPKIKGVTNGTIYYTTQYVTVTDTNLKSVTVNGNETSKTFFIDGNITNMYIIEAVDTDENVTSCIVYTKPISTLLEPINHLNENTTTTDDLDTLNNIKKTAQQFNTKYSTNYEADEISAVVNTCDKFINKIKQVKKQLSAIEKKVNVYETTGIYESVNVVMDEIDALLATDNLTTEQRQYLAKLHSKCEQWLHIPPEIYEIYQNME